MTYLQRSSAGALREYLTVFRVVHVAGARQVGKTTLAQHEGGTRRFISLDDRATREQCAADPTGFLRAFGDEDLLIDEVQRVPDLALAIKREVDANPRPGRFLITGSADARAVAHARDSLAGRLGPLVLRPLSQGEITSTSASERFLDRLLAESDPTWSSATERGFADYANRVIGGGYPQSISLGEGRRGTWLRAYVDEVLSRDVRELVNIEDVGRLRRVFQIAASGSGQLLKRASIARDAELAKATASAWVGLLEATHLVDVIPAWGGSHRKRVVHVPKLYVNDTGLLSAVLRVNAPQVAQSPHLAGTFAETFVVQEILRQASFHPDRALTISHYRDRDLREIDLILELEDGTIHAIEVKASASISPSDARHIEALARKVGDRFRRGLVIYCGEHPLPLTDRVMGVPMANLWS